MKNIFVNSVLAVSALVLAGATESQLAAQSTTIIFPNSGPGCHPNSTGGTARQVMTFNCSGYFGGIVQGMAITQQTTSRITGRPVTIFTVTNFVAENQGWPNGGGIGQIIFKVPQTVATSGKLFASIAITGQFYDLTSPRFDRGENFNVGGFVSTNPYPNSSNWLYTGINNFNPSFPAVPNPYTFAVANFGFLDIYDPNYLYVSLSAESSAFYAQTRTGVRLPGSFHVAIGADQADLPLVPEPGTWMLMVAGFGAIGLAVRRRSANASAAASLPQPCPRSS